MKQLTYDEAIEKYGKIELGKWEHEFKHMTSLKINEDISKNWINTASKKSVNKIYCNASMAMALLTALNNVKTKGLISELKTFDGCFEIRKARGTDKLSCHAYGLAIDINASENALGAEPTMSAELVKCFTEAGFTWGGSFLRKDGMHFSYGWE